MRLEVGDEVVLVDDCPGQQVSEALAELVADQRVRPRPDTLERIAELLRSRAAHRLVDDPAGTVADSTAGLALEPYLADPGLMAALYGLRAYATSTTAGPAAALPDYDAAVTRAPDHATYRNNRSVARRLTGDLRGALTDAREAVAGDRGSGLYWLTLAEAHAALARDDDALLALRRALQIDPLLRRRLADPLFDRVRDRAQAY